MSDDLGSDLTSRNIPVVKDSTFSRCVADAGLVIDSGRDLEISFIQTSPEISSRFVRGVGSDTNNIAQGFVMQPSLNEVSRVRINRPSALTMAIMIIEILIEDGRIDEDSFARQIKDIFEKVSRISIY